MGKENKYARVRRDSEQENALDSNAKDDSSEAPVKDEPKDRESVQSTLLSINAKRRKENKPFAILSYKHAQTVYLIRCPWHMIEKIKREFLLDNKHPTGSVIKQGTEEEILYYLKDSK